jgi:hypothetical protein
MHGMKRCLCGDCSPVVVSILAALVFYSRIGTTSKNVKEKEKKKEA